MTIITEKIICSKHYRIFNTECKECSFIVINSNKLNMFTKKCIRCSEEFKSGRASTQFCYNKYKITCKECKGTFIQSCCREKDFKKQCINRGCRSKNLTKELLIKTDICNNCGDSFVNKNNGKYCKSEKIKSCDYCNKKIKFICDKDGVPRGCSQSCSSKNNNAKRIYTQNLNKCHNCNIDISKNRGKYCFNSYHKECEFCFEEFTYECNRRLSKTCSKNCKNALLNNWPIPKDLRIYFKNLDTWAKEFTEQHHRSPNYFDYKDFFKIDLPPPSNCRKYFNPNGKKYRKNCEYCDEAFETNFSYKKYCDGSHYMNCSFCNEKYKIDAIYKDIENVRKFCSSSCGTFSQLNSVIHKDRIKEYINIDEWAINFMEKNNRKPKRNDVYNYFNTSKINKKVNMDNFDVKAKFSLLEDMVEKQLLNLGFTVIGIRE